MGVPTNITKAKQLRPEYGWYLATTLGEYTWHCLKPYTFPSAARGYLKRNGNMPDYFQFLCKIDDAVKPFYISENEAQNLFQVEKPAPLEANAQTKWLAACNFQWKA